VRVCVYGCIYNLISETVNFGMIGKVKYYPTSHFSCLQKCLFDTRVQKVITTNEEVVSDIDLDSCVLKTDELKTYISASCESF